MKKMTKSSHHRLKVGIAGFITGVVILVVGSGSYHKFIPKTHLTPVSTSSGIIVPTASVVPHNGCQVRGVLPDPSCTPGAVNPNVTQDNIQSTICVSGFTKTIRPPASFTDNLKIRQIQEYGYSDVNTSDYEEDHLIPLEVGGSPDSSLNLWPESRLGTPNATDKDKVENLLHQEVCSGQKTLQEAQKEISTDWTQVQ